MLEAQGARVVPRRPTGTRAALSSAKQEVGRKKYRWEGASVFSPNANERRQETCLSTAPWCLQRERPGEKPPELTNRTASPGGTARVRWSSGGRLQGHTKERRGARVGGGWGLSKAEEEGPRTQASDDKEPWPGLPGAPRGQGLPPQDPPSCREGGQMCASEAASDE